MIGSEQSYSDHRKYKGGSTSVAYSDLFHDNPIVNRGDGGCRILLDVFLVVFLVGSGQ